MPDQTTPHPGPQQPPPHDPFEAFPSPAPLKVVVADDNPVVRAGLTALLSGRADITVVAEAADGRQAYEAAIQTHPDVVLLDVRMPGVDGISALPYLVPIAPVVMLTYSRESEIVQEALRRAPAATWCTASSPRTNWWRRYGTSRRAGPTSPRRRRALCWRSYVRARDRAAARPSPRGWARRMRLHTVLQHHLHCKCTPKYPSHKVSSPTRAMASPLILQKTFRKCNRMWDSRRQDG